MWLLLKATTPPRFSEAGRVSIRQETNWKPTCLFPCHHSAMPAGAIPLARKSHGSPISIATLDLLLPTFLLLLKDTFDISFCRLERMVFLFTWELPGWHVQAKKGSPHRTSINRSKILKCVEWDFTTAIRYLHTVYKSWKMWPAQVPGRGKLSVFLRGKIPHR